jgi:predicted DsbA family dithiol-disulfide isomerase/uncharacterized membrane protein
MHSRSSPLPIQVASLVGLAVSSALLVDYLRPVAAFCQAGSGCDRVRASGFGYLFGLPVPLLGLLGFAVLLTVSLRPGPGARYWTRLLASAAGVIGIALIVVQKFQIKEFCKLCLVVDGAAIVAAASALFLAPSPAQPEQERSPPGRGWLWAAAAFLAAVMPIGWSYLIPAPPAPPEIVRHWVPGKINVVEFADFECPFCRQLHPEMLEVLHEHEGKVNFVRLNMPLASHPHSRDAARAYCCAEEQGKATAMADALFAAEGLTREDCERIAASLQLSMPEYRACVASASTEQKIDQQVSEVRSSGLRGLPTVWVEDRMIVGLTPIDTLREAFAQAASGKHPRHFGAAWLWGGLSITLGALTLLASRSRSRAT